MVFAASLGSLLGIYFNLKKGIILVLIDFILIVIHYVKLGMDPGSSIGYGVLYILGGIFFIVYFIGFGTFTGLLCLFHTFLISVNQTTYERVLIFSKTDQKNKN